jgi:hypothetical protein
LFARRRCVFEEAVSSNRPLAETGNDMERLLLAAGAGERPGVESTRRAARALGFVPRAALVAALLATARAIKWTSVAAWSSVALVAVAGVVALAAHGGPSPSRAGVAGVLPAAKSPPPAQPVAAPPLPAETSASPSLDGTSTPLLTEGMRVPRRVQIATARADRLREEADALDAARELLTLGNAAGALAKLEAYQRRFAGGALREEALLLRIEALVRAGDRATASAAAHHFLRTYPASMHVRRVTALLEGLPEPQEK